MQHVLDQPTCHQNGGAIAMLGPVTAILVKLSTKLRHGQDQRVIKGIPNPLRRRFRILS